uniref:Uncharacterized protein n=1 Tax=Arundo donax TaxID=35708 RepID=A0A0A9CWW2_ARUDO
MDKIPLPGGTESSIRPSLLASCSMDIKNSSVCSTPSGVGKQPMYTRSTIIQQSGSKLTDQRLLSSFFPSSSSSSKSFLSRKFINLLRHKP